MAWFCCSQAHQQERARQRILEDKAEREGKIAGKREELYAQKTQGADVLRKQRELIDHHLREQKAQHVERARNISEVSPCLMCLASR